MRTTAVTIAFLTLVAAAPMADDSESSVVGLWLGEARTAGGLGTWIELRADGTARIDFGAVVGGLPDDTYQLDRGTLRVRMFTGRTSTSGKPMSETVEKQVHIEGDRAVVETPSPLARSAPDVDSPSEKAMYERLRRPIAMRRVGPSTGSDSGIVGTWSYEHYTGATAYETFTPGGNWYLRIPMEVVHGTYSVTGDAVTIRRAAGEETFTREGNVLRPAVNGRRSTYRRAPE